jgi:hypothetical protein
MIAFQGGWLDITEPTKATVIKESNLGTFQSCVYNKQLKKWIRVVSHQMPLTPGTRQYPRGKYHQEYARKSIDDPGFRGIKTYDVTNPEKTELLNEFETGKNGFGVHCPFYDGGRYGYLACGWDDQLRMESTERVYSNGLMVVDMSDPAKVKEVSRWWVPGQRLDEEELYRTTYPFAGDQCSWTGNRTPCIVPVRVEDGGTVGYGGWGHFGMYVHDLTDIRNPKVFGKVTHPLEAIGGIPFHHVVPVNADPARHPRLQNLVIAIPECLESDCREPWHTSYVVDVKDPSLPASAAASGCALQGLCDGPRTLQLARHAALDCAGKGASGYRRVVISQCRPAPVRHFGSDRAEGSGVFRSATRRRDGRLHELAARHERGGLHRMGSQPDLAIDPCWRLLFVGTVPGYACA